jgi:hypothetical protein
MAAAGSDYSFQTELVLAEFRDGGDAFWTERIQGFY